MKWWFVKYDTKEWAGLTLAVRCETRSEIKAIVKKHLGNADFKITSIAEMKGGSPYEKKFA